MLNAGFVAALALVMFALIVWGVRTLPAERWQMLAAVPIAKSVDGSWRGLNLTFYGFFSATGTAFGFAIMWLLLGSVGIPVVVSIALVLLILLVCVPASRMIAGLVENKRNTFTVAGAAFVATIVLPLLVLALQPLAAHVLHCEIPVLPTFAAAAIAYVLAESIGRLACLSFGCCYGMPLRDANPTIARLFQKHNLVIHGATKKAAYASGLDGEPLIPVQAVTSAVFAVSGIAGVALFLTRHHFDSHTLPGQIAFGLIFGGIAGNLTDRLLPGRHAVVDFLHFYLQRRGSGEPLDFPAFNVADSAICTGVGLIFLISWRNEQTAKPATGDK